jgi:phage N-6-adenine-methyltransferase
VSRPGAEVCYTAPKSIEWGTPQVFFDALHREFGFTLDVAASAENAKVAHYFDAETDGLSQDWSGHVCWMNPPYGREIRDWMRKAYETGKGGTTVVCLVPARTDTRWWWDFAIHGEVRFFKGRLSFTGGSQSNPESHNAPFPMALVVFGREPGIRWAPRPDVDLGLFAEGASS